MTFLSHLYSDEEDQSATLESYLVELTSTNLKRVLEEKSRLTQSIHSVEEEQQNFIYSNLQTIVYSTSTISTTRKNLNTIGKTLNQFTGTLNKFQKGCNDFLHSLKKHEDSKKKVRSAIKQEQRISSLITIPSLVRTLVHNSQYNDAVRLCSFAKKLSRKHLSHTVIQSLIGSLSLASVDFEQELINRLSRKLVVQKCIELVPFLRTLGGYRDRELWVLFLQTRDRWLRKEIASSRRNTNSRSRIELLESTIHSTRQGISEIMTEYNTLFSGHKPARVLSDWICRKVNDLCVLIKEAINRAETGSELNILLERSMWVGSFLARVGIDFRNLFIVEFESALLRIVSKNLDQGKRLFRNILPKWDYSKRAQLALMLKQQMSNTNLNNKRIIPPYQLLEFLPITQLCNCYIQIFNHLKNLALNSVEKRIFNLFENHFLQITKIILQQIKNKQKNVNLQDFVDSFINVLGPFVDNSLKLIFDIQKTQTPIHISSKSLLLETISKIENNNL
ncbi:conserved oligomeric golgi complex component 8 [Anaeramoeba flamelloides]|uniref:Conserved oligomeric Golgi complex subunit 8 n=1 Tax=Anaeramoeba flamelloides TaxID=1746091 RepID=A0ABQ8XFG9_9EUKA|nr:conserved oligomeric golgi complex component 8 [Anaeramoeba flamelloides]